MTNIELVQSCKVKMRLRYLSFVHNNNNNYEVSDLGFRCLQCNFQVFSQLLPVVSHLLRSLGLGFSQGDGFIVNLHIVTLEDIMSGCWERGGTVRTDLRVNVMSDVVQSVPAPDAVPALEQFLRGDVHLLVDPTVVLILRNVIALLARNSLLLLYFVTSGAAMEVHLKREVITVRSARLVGVTESLSLTSQTFVQENEQF